MKFTFIFYAILKLIFECNFNSYFNQGSINVLKSQNKELEEELDSKMKEVEHLQQTVGEKNSVIKQQELKIGELQDQLESEDKNYT